MPSSVARRLKVELGKMDSHGLLVRGRWRLPIRLRPCYANCEGGRPLPFDMAIEFRMTASDALERVWVWHCIDYAYPLNLAEAQEFAHRVAVFGHATPVHGTVATSGSVESGARALLGQHGIGIVHTNIELSCLDSYIDLCRRLGWKIPFADATLLIRGFETVFAWSSPSVMTESARLRRPGAPLDTPTFMRKQLD